MEVLLDGLARRHRTRLTFGSNTTHTTARKLRSSSFENFVSSLHGNADSRDGVAVEGWFGFGSTALGVDE